MGIRNDECKRVSALLALVLALSVVLLVAAAAPVRAYDSLENTLSAYVETWAKTGVGTTYINEDHDWDGPYEEPAPHPLKADCKSESEYDKHASASARAWQYVSVDHVFGKPRCEAEADEGYCAYADVFLEGDPVGGSPFHGQWLPAGITLDAEGTGVALANVTLWDSIEGKQFEGTATLTSAGLSTTGPPEWCNRWVSGEKPGGGRKAVYPPDAILKDTKGHKFYTWCTLNATVNGGGKAMATTIATVGGTAFPVDKLALLAPYITLAIAVVAVALGAVSARKRWLGKAVLPTP